MIYTGNILHLNNIIILFVGVYSRCFHFAKKDEHITNKMVKPLMWDHTKNPIQSKISDSKWQCDWHELISSQIWCYITSKLYLLCVFYPLKTLWYMTRRFSIPLVLLNFYKSLYQYTLMTCLFYDLIMLSFHTSTISKRDVIKKKMLFLCRQIWQESHTKKMYELNLFPSIW